MRGRRFAAKFSQGRSKQLHLPTNFADQQLRVVAVGYIVHRLDALFIQRVRTAVHTRARRARTVPKLL